MDRKLLRRITTGPLPDHSDDEVAVALARFAHEEFETFGTTGATDLDQGQSILVIDALRAVLARLGVSISTRRSATSKDSASTGSGSGGWDKRRRCLEEHFEPLHEVLAERQAGMISSTLATAVSPGLVTGWPRVDEEISELRRHFEAGSAAQPRGELVE